MKLNSRSTQCLKIKLEKKSIKKIQKKNNSSQPELTSQTRNLSHEKEDNLIKKPKQTTKSNSQSTQY